MRRTLLGLWLLAGVLPLPVAAQQWTGTAALGLTGGHQTNTYLDPVLRSWDRPSDPTYAALTPQIGLVRNTSRTRLDLTAQTRLYPGRQNVPQFAQGNARLRYRLSPAWTVGAAAGGTRYRFALSPDSVSSRNSWWALPSLQWAATPSVTLTVRGGLTERYVATGRGTDRQPSGLAALSADAWLTDRLNAEGRLYWSNGRTSIADAQFGGTGASLRGTFWPTGRWSVEATVAAEQLRYEDVQSSSTVRDRIGRGGIRTQWNVHSSVRLFAHAQALVARLAQADEDEADTDVHVSVGLRFQVQEVLGGTSEPPPQRRVCREVEGRVQVRIPYDGTGTPHLTGDFNGWSLPGTSMTRADGDTWTTTLSLPPGQYAYRVRIVDDSDRRWLDLPSYAQTADDSFGGTNGVCTVH